MMNIKRGGVKTSLLIFLLFNITFLTFAQNSNDTTPDNTLKEIQKYSKDPFSTNETSESENKPKIRVGGYSYFRVVLSLLLVLGIIFLIYYFLKRKLKINDSSGEVFLLSTQMLSAGKWIQTVYVSGKYLVLGVTNENINLITEITDKKEIERLEILYNERKAAEGISFTDMFGDFFKTRLKPNKAKSFDYETDSVDFLKEQNERLNNLKNKDD